MKVFGKVQAQSDKLARIAAKIYFSRLPAKGRRDVRRERGFLNVTGMKMLWFKSKETGRTELTPYGKREMARRHRREAIAKATRKANQRQAAKARRARQKRRKRQ